MAFFAKICHLLSGIDFSGQKQWNKAFAHRESLDPEQFYERYFKDRGIPKDTVVRVKRVFDENASFDLTRISATDDFSKELKFIWSYDSLADVETVISLEKEFGIQLTDAEAAGLKTLNEIVDLVHAKASACSKASEG